MFTADTLVKLELYKAHTQCAHCNWEVTIVTAYRKTTLVTACSLASILPNPFWVLAFYSHHKRFQYATWEICSRVDKLGIYNLWTNQTLLTLCYYDKGTSSRAKRHLALSTVSILHIHVHTVTWSAAFNATLISFMWQNRWYAHVQTDRGGAGQ